MPRQRTWNQTQRVLKSNCKIWLNTPIDDIAAKDAQKLLQGFVAEGHGYKAGITRAWLKKLWRWAYKNHDGLVTSPIMEAVDINFTRKKRTRVYSDDDIKATWEAADKLKPEGAFIKLMILLIPRKTNLVSMRWSEVVKRKIKVRGDDGKTVEQEMDLWITPPERVKQSKKAEEEADEPREYLTPLPPLALRILKGLTKTDGQDRVFASLSLYKNKRTGRLQFQRGRWLYKQLVKLGAPKYLKDMPTIMPGGTPSRLG